MFENNKTFYTIMPTVKISQSIKNTGGQFFSPLTHAVLAHIQQIWSSCKSMQFLHCKYLRRQTRAFLLQHTEKVICVMLLHCMGKLVLLPPIFLPPLKCIKAGEKSWFFFRLEFYALEFKSSAPASSLTEEEAQMAQNPLKKLWTFVSLIEI